MYRALLLCNSMFPADPAGLHRLRGPQRDGLVLWNALVDRDSGRFSPENVHVLFEGTRDETAGAAEAFFTSADPDDVLLFYYSGHGRRQAGELVLCCRDTLTSRPMSTGLGCDALNKVIRTSSARAVVVILDCCFGGAFKGEESIEDDLAGAGRFVIAAASAVEEANDAEKDGHASPFTAALAYGLAAGAPDNDHDGLVSLEDLFTYVTAALPPTCPRPRRKFDGTGTIPIAIRVPKARDITNEQVGVLESHEQFDQLIEQLALPTPRLSTRDMIISLGTPAIDGLIDVLAELTPHDSTDSHIQPRMTERQRRLVPRIREILVRMMPVSGQRLLARLRAEVRHGNTDFSSRLIQCLSKDLATDGLIEFYRSVLESDLAPRLFMRILASIEDCSDFPLTSLDLTQRTIEGLSYKSARRFNGLNFAGSTFRNVQLYELDLADNCFDSAVFDNCTLWRVRFDGCSLRESSLIGGRTGLCIPGTTFTDCDLTGAKFNRVYADEQFRDNHKTDLERFDRISFAGARLGGASFLDSDLRLADFTGCEEVEDVRDWAGSRLFRARGLSFRQFDLVRERGGRA